METIPLDIAAFRATFPAFSNVTTYPDALITLQWGLATGYVSDSTYGDMALAARTSALQLMTAHLLTLNSIAVSSTSGGTTGMVTSSTVGDVSVTIAAPPYGTSAWRFWLMSTPYGMQLIGLLEAQAVGGFYIGGRPERSAFRKVGGCF